MDTYKRMRFQLLSKGGRGGNNGENRTHNAAADNSGNSNEGDKFQRVLGAVYTALRPYPEATAAVERMVAELLGSDCYGGSSNRHLPGGGESGGGA